LNMFVCPSSLEQANMSKGLNKVPAAACRDYEGIPLLTKKSLDNTKYEKVFYARQDVQGS